MMPILLPTRGRPDNIRRFIKAYDRTKATEPVFLLVDEDDATWRTLELPDHWKFCLHAQEDRKKGIAYYCNLHFELYPNEEYYAVIADDVVPETEHWDQILKAACLPDKIAWADDGIQGKNLPTHPFIGGDLVRKLGWISHPNLKHWYVDNVWKDIANLTDGVYLPNIKLTHHHWVNGKAEKDDTYNQVPDPEIDRWHYNKIREQGGIAARYVHSANGEYKALVYDDKAIS